MWLDNSTDEKEEPGFHAISYLEILTKVHGISMIFPDGVTFDTYCVASCWCWPYRFVQSTPRGRNNSRKNEEMEPKQKQYLAVMTNQGVGGHSQHQTHRPGAPCPSVSSVFDFGSSEVTDLGQALPGHVGRDGLHSCPPGPAASLQKARPTLYLFSPAEALLTLCGLKAL